MAEKLYKVTSKEEYLAWALETKSMSNEDAMRIWDARLAEHTKWGTASDKVVAQASMLSVRKLPSTGTFKVLCVGMKPLQDWTEIARSAAEKTDTPNCMPWGEGKGEKEIPALSRYQTSVLFLGYEVDKAGVRMGDYSMYSLNAEDDLNDTDRDANAPMRTEIIRGAFSNYVGKVCTFKCGKARAKADALVMSLFLMDNAELKVEAAEDNDLITGAAAILEKIAPARKITMENIEDFKVGKAKYLLGFINGNIDGVNHAEKMGSWAITMTDGTYGEIFTGWLDDDTPRIFPDSCSEAVIFVSNIRNSTKDGTLQMDVFGVLPNASDMKRVDKAAASDHNIR